MDAFLYNGDSYFLNQEFPLVVNYHKQRGSVLHAHDFYELVIVRNGSGQHVTESLAYPIAAGDVFVLSPQFKHYYTDTNNLELINILYSPEKLSIPRLDITSIPGYYVLFEVEPSLREKGQFKSRLTLGMEQLAAVEKIVSKLHGELKQRSSGYCFTALAHFMELISCLSRSYASYNNKFSRKLLRASSMMNFIEHNFREKIGLDDIVRRSNMSLSTANRAFREAMDMTPIDYLIKVRIEYAAKLLKDSNLSVMEIAEKSGFSDSNYFTKQFRKIMGNSPRSYRKLL